MAIVIKTLETETRTLFLAGREKGLETIAKGICLDLSPGMQPKEWFTMNATYLRIIIKK